MLKYEKIFEILVSKPFCHIAAKFANQCYFV